MNIPGVSIYKPARRNRKSDPWLIAYGPRHDRKVVSASPDRQITNELAVKLAKTVERVRLGLVDAAEMRFDGMSLLPIKSHVDEYCDSLKTSGRSKKHVKQYEDYLTTIFDGCRCAYIREVISVRVQKVIAALKTSGQTKNRYVAAFHGLMNWGVKDKRWPQTFADSVKLDRFTAGDKRTRRVLTMEELSRLIEAATGGDVAEKLPGETRALIYKLALASGLRANELRTLAVDDIRDTGIRVKSGNDKTKQESFIVLPAEMVADLRTFAGDRTGRIFDVSENLHRMIRHDLAVAGIDYKNDEGVFDFHALRHQCGSLLLEAGVDVKSVQKHMRHASAKMTLDVYGHQLDEGKKKSAAAIGKIVQRVAQRNPVQNCPTLSRKDNEMSSVTSENQWSDGESNPDLLNAIQSTYRGLSLKNGRIHSPRRGELAPSAAQAVLSAFYRRVSRKSR